MAASVVVRHLVHQDYDRWLPLWIGYNAFYGRSGATALAPEITAMTWSRFFDAYEPVHALVAESDGELLGLTHFLFHRTTTAIQPLCYLNDLFTSEKARGKGVGRALIEAVYEKARAAGSPRVYWQTHETNRDGARALRQGRRALGFHRLPAVALGFACLPAHGSTIARRPHLLPRRTAPSKAAPTAWSRKLSTL